jgi:RsiW-degrading membrane proteinase PrsW (M82 family)
MAVETILTAVLAAIVYSMSMYIKKAINTEEPQDFDTVKFSSTVVVGAIVGAVMHMSGVPITEESFQNQFIAYAGLVALVENILKILKRALVR